MFDETTGRDASTRREYVRGMAALAGGAALAGCAGDVDSTPTPADSAAVVNGEF